MQDDPIVTEIRRAGARLAEKSGYDIHRFFENLRKSQAKHPNRLVRRAPVHLPPSKPTA